MKTLLCGEVRSAPALGEADVKTAYAGDMLSDVLALGSQPDALLTGLLNPQVIRTAEMLDTACVVFLRGKEPDASILELAEKCGVCVEQLTYLRDWTEYTFGYRLLQHCALGKYLRKAQIDRCVVRYGDRTQILGNERLL